MRTRAQSSASPRAATPKGAKESLPAPSGPAVTTLPQAEAAPRPTVERASRLGLHPSRIAAGLGNPVQRLFGFEAELSVPSMGPPPNAVDARFRPGLENAQATPVIQQFLMGGLPYDDRDLSQADAFRLTVDHNALAALGEGAKRELVEAGYLQASFGPPVSNLEYATEPVDELKPGADAEIGAQVDAIAENMTSTYSTARTQVTQVDATENVYAGFPAQELSDWLGINFDDDIPSLGQLQDAINNDLYLQVTAGILPSAIPGLYSMAETQQGGLLMDRLEIASKVRARVDALWEQEPFTSHEYLLSLSEVSQKSLKGLLYLIFGYMVGDAIWQTSLIPDGTSGKNALLFLPQMKPENFGVAAPSLKLTDDDGPTQDFAKIVSRFLLGSPFVLPATWANAFQGEVRNDRDHVVEHPYDLIVWKALSGQTVETVSPHDMRGDEQQQAVKNVSEDQKGVPLELRTIQAHPKPGGLKAAVLALVDQVRELNTQHMNDVARQAVIAAAKAPPENDQANADGDANADQNANADDDPFAALGDGFGGF